MPIIHTPDNTRYLNVNITIDKRDTCDTIAATNTNTQANKGQNIMTTLNHSSVTTFTKDTQECKVIQLGNYSDSDSDLHSVSIHDVLNVTRHTRTIGKGADKFTVTVVKIHTATGTVDIDCFRSKV